MSTSLAVLFHLHQTADTKPCFGWCRFFSWDSTAVFFWRVRHRPGLMTWEWNWSREGGCHESWSFINGNLRGPTHPNCRSRQKPHKNYIAGLNFRDLEGIMMVNNPLRLTKPSSMLAGNGGSSRPSPILMPKEHVHDCCCPHRCRPGTNMVEIWKFHTLQLALEEK